MNITLAPHLQQALEALSEELRLEPQAVLNQAVFAWLRSNGYAAPPLSIPVALAKPSQAQEPLLVPVPVMNEPVDAPPPSAPVMRSIATPAPMPEVREMPSASPLPQTVPLPEPVAEQAALPTDPEPTAPEPDPVAVASSADAVVARMKEIDADLEALTRPWPDWVAPVEDAPEEEQQEEEEAPAPRAAAADEPPAPEVPAVAARSSSSSDSMPGDDEKTILPGAMHALQFDPDSADEGSTIVLKSAPIALYLEREGDEPVKVEVERFIIGRGPQCDLVIDSPRVSREHLVITRQGLRYFAKDLNSSNGTWLGEDRVTEREIDNGETLHLGNEAVTFVLRTPSV